MPTGAFDMRIGLPTTRIACAPSWPNSTMRVLKSLLGVGAWANALSVGFALLEGGPPERRAPGNSATLTVTTTAPSFALNLSAVRLSYALWLPLFGLLVAGAGRSRKHNAKGRAFGLLLCGLLMFGLTLQVACGGGSSTGGSGGTAKGNYTVTISGTSGSLVHSTTVTLTVQ